MSIRQEHEQELIQKSIHIDEKTGKAVASLAFIEDPLINLKPNKNVAEKRLEILCKKVGKTPKIVDMTSKGFNKLLERGHIIPLENLTHNQRERILNAPASYFIPWDLAFKEGSLSTPARPVMDASSRTPGGKSLNEILAKGNADLANLVGMLLSWVIGPVGFCSDISQFYNSILLNENDWQYQQILWYDDLDTSKKLRHGIICTCIYGVTCVGAQTEFVMLLLADEIEPNNQEVAALLR